MSNADGIMDNLEEIFEMIAHIRDDGHMVFIKFDGERDKEKNTIILDLKHDGKREVMQWHGDDLLVLLNKLLAAYRDFQSAE